MTSCASLTTVARQPPVVMQDAPVGRGGDEPDGGRDRHDGLATPYAGLLTGRALRAREHRLSFRVTPTDATSRQDGPVLLLGGSGKVSFGRRIREDPLISVFRVSYIYTHSEVVSSPK